MPHSDLPFIVTSALLVLWGSGKSDSNVAFLGVASACAYILVEALVFSAEGNSKVVFPPSVLSSTDVFSDWFADQPRSLGTFLMMVFCFAFGAVGTTVFTFSPFLGELLYATVVSALFRDESIVGDARVIVWICVLLSGALSEHIFRLNMTALIIGVLMLEMNVVLPQRGATESICFLNSVLILTVHDLVVRFLMTPLTSLVEAGFLGMTAYVIVDSAFELAALPGGSRERASNVSFSSNFLAIKWTDCLRAESSPFEMRYFAKRVSLASPVLVSLFCAGYVLRLLKANRSIMSWIKWQQLAGVGAGIAIGLYFWTRYGGVQNFQMTSPIAVCWVATALFFASSSLLKVKSSSSGKSDIWHQIYWRGSSKFFGNKKTNMASGAGKSKKPTPYPTLLLNSFSATYPEVYDLAVKLEDDHYALESNLVKLHSVNLKMNKGVDHAKQAFTCTQLVNTLVKHCEDLVAKVEARFSAVQTEIRIMGLAHESTPYAQKNKQRLNLLQQDLAGIHSYAEQLKRELAKRDEETLGVLENALRNFSFQVDKQSLSAEAEHQQKQEADVLDSMCEAVRKRIKHRKRKEDASVLNESSVMLNTSVPQPPTGNSANEASPNVEGLPVIPPNQAMFPSERDSNNGSSPSKKSRGLFRIFSKKKKEVASPENSLISEADRVSSSGGSSKRLGLFRRKPASPASPSSPAL